MCSELGQQEMASVTSFSKRGEERSTQKHMLPDLWLFLPVRTPSRSLSFRLSFFKKVLPLEKYLVRLISIHLYWICNFF